MSDLVKEAAQSFSPTADLSNQAVNKRKLLALSSRGTSTSGFSGDQASALVDAFAEVFASMAVSSPSPIESSSGASGDASTSEEVAVEAAEHSGEADQDDSPKDSADDTAIQSQAAGLAEFAVESQEAKIVADEPVDENAPVLDTESGDAAEEIAEEVIEVVAEEAATEASQLAVASTVSQTSSEFELDDQVSLPISEVKEEPVESKPDVAPVNQDSSKPLTRQSENTEGTQGETTEAAGLNPDQQQDDQGGHPAGSEDRRRYSKDDRSANQRPPAASAVEPTSDAKTTTVAQNQNSESSISQALGSAATPSGDRPAVPPVSAAANAANAAVAAVGSASAVSSSVSSTASRGANGITGIANGPTSSDGARSFAGSEQGARPDLASPSKSSKKADAGTNQADTLNRIKLVQRVSRAFQHLGPEGGVVRLRLAPVELGTVRVEMQIQQKKVNARVVAETDAASSALREHLPELRARLEAHGMQIESLEVETQSDDTDSSGLDHRSPKDSADQRHANGERQSRSDRTGRRETSDQNRPVPAPVSRPPVSLASAGSVDIRF